MKASEAVNGARVWTMIEGARREGYISLLTYPLGADKRVAVMLTPELPGLEIIYRHVSRVHLIEQGKKGGAR